MKRTGIAALSPITLAVRDGVSYLQDYFTLAQAHDLGSRLMALALEVESAEAETEHFDRLDSEEHDAMQAECDTSLQLAKSALPLIDAALGGESTPEAA